MLVFPLKLLLIFNIPWEAVEVAELPENGRQDSKLNSGDIYLFYRRERFFMIRAVKHWDRLPREVLEAPTLGTLKVRLDRSSEHPDLLQMLLFVERKLG